MTNAPNIKVSSVLALRVREPFNFFYIVGWRLRAAVESLVEGPLKCSLS